MERGYNSLSIKYPYSHVFHDVFCLDLFVLVDGS